MSSVSDSRLTGTAQHIVETPQTAVAQDGGMHTKPVDDSGTSTLSTSSPETTKAEKCPKSCLDSICQFIWRIIRCLFCGLLGDNQEKAVELSQLQTQEPQQTESSATVLAKQDSATAQAFPLQTQEPEQNGVPAAALGKKESISTPIMQPINEEIVLQKLQKLCYQYPDVIFEDIAFSPSLGIAYADGTLGLDGEQVTFLAFAKGEFEPIREADLVDLPDGYLVRSKSTEIRFRKDAQGNAGGIESINGTAVQTIPVSLCNELLASSPLQMSLRSLRIDNSTTHCITCTQVDGTGHQILINGKLLIDAEHKGFTRGIGYDDIKGISLESVKGVPNYLKMTINFLDADTLTWFVDISEPSRETRYPAYMFCPIPPFAPQPITEGAVLTKLKELGKDHPNLAFTDVVFSPSLGLAFAKVRDDKSRNELVFLAFPGCHFEEVDERDYQEFSHPDHEEIIICPFQIQYGRDKKGLLRINGLPAEIAGQEDSWILTPD